MADEDRGDALQSQWPQELSGWRVGIAAAYQVIEHTPVKVLVWGPGTHSPDYAKRRSIVDHIAQQNPANEVRTSEELIEAQPPPPGLSVYQVEEIHWREADIVFAIITKDSRVTGSRAEIAKWGDDPDFVGKSYLITPRLSKRQRERLGFLDLGWHRFPLERKLEYTDAEYRDCTHIREYCAEAVVRLRSARGFLAWRHSER